MAPQNIVDKVELALNSIRPYLEADGGNVKLLEISDDLVATVELLGSCNGCPMSASTFKAGIVETIRQRAPEIKEVKAINI